MTTNRLLPIFLLIALFNVSLRAYAQTTPENLHFRTSQGQLVQVHGGTIAVNNKILYKFQYDDIIYDSKRNKIIDDNGSVFLFLEIDGRPNLNRLYAFRITSNKVDSLADAISSDIKDVDGDGYLEFGGRDLTEMYPAKDSMYYIPTNYYEIRDGRIWYDSALTRNMDIRLNGVYLANPIDADGNCCKVIIKPVNKVSAPVSLVNPLIISERIDGPANIRDTINGKNLFTLNDNVAVQTADIINHWYPVGLSVDLNPQEYKTHSISKGSALYYKGVQIGKAVENIHLEDTYNDKGKFSGELAGYTSMQNIKQETLPENVLSAIVGNHSTVTKDQLHDFIVGFQFLTSTRGAGDSTTYQLDGGTVYGPSAPLRLLLVFRGDKLFAVVHLRKLTSPGAQQYILKRDYYLWVVGVQDPQKVAAFIQQFNAMIVLAG